MRFNNQLAQSCVWHLELHFCKQNFPEKNVDLLFLTKFSKNVAYKNETQGASQTMVYSASADSQ